MGKWMDRFQKSIKYVDTGVDFAREALPETKAEEIVTGTEEGGQLKFDIYNAVILGEEKLLDAHDLKNVPPEVEEHLDAAAISLSKAGLIWAGLKKHKVAAAELESENEEVAAEPDDTKPA